MPRTTEQNQKIREATRAEIISSAMILFGKNGYAPTTTRMITQHAGISAGLMYHYFDGKESLLLAVFENCMGILDAAFSEAYLGSLPHERITSIVGAIFDMLERDREFWGLFYMLRTQPAIMAILGEPFRHWTVQLRNLFITELREAGREDPEIEALLLYSLIEGTIQQYLLDPANYPLEAVANRIINQFTS
jgi:AcrR family transcriptional regulator